VVQIEKKIRVLGILGLDAPPVENGNIPEVWLELCWKNHGKNTTSGGFESPFGGNSTSKN